MTKVGGVDGSECVMRALGSFSVFRLVAENSLQHSDTVTFNLFSCHALLLLDKTKSNTRNKNNNTRHKNGSHAMELTTRLPAPSNTSIICVIIKIAIILLFLFLIVEDSHENPKDISHQEYHDTTSSSSPMAHFINDTLPRLVASGLTFYVGICCGYVGLVHLGWLPN